MALMIVCCGEALIDMLPRTLPDGEAVLLPVAGGAVFNTAIALGRLGIDAGFFCGLSNDMFGKQLAETLQKSKVDSSFCPRSDRPTTLAFVELLNGQARYVFYDEQTAGRMITADDLPTFDARVKALHFGAISLIPEPCGASYEALLMREADKRIISLDPNIRANFIPDADGHRARIRRMVAKSHIIKVSDEDLDWLEPEKNSAEVIRSWIDTGALIVVVTKGAEGASATTRNGSIDVPAQSVSVVDTVGAGDSFDAGLLAGLERVGRLERQSIAGITNEELESALKLAASVASITVSRAGANPPWLHELA